MQPVDLQFIDFGCGNGRSSEFASSVVAGRGFGIDISDDAVDACRAKGLAAERGDLLKFEQRSVAVATFAIGEAGAANAALTAIAILAAGDEALAERLEAFRAAQSDAARAMTLPPA